MAAKYDVSEKKWSKGAAYKGQLAHEHERTSILAQCGRIRVVEERDFWSNERRRPVRQRRLARAGLGPKPSIRGVFWLDGSSLHNVSGAGMISLAPGLAGGIPGPGHEKDGRCRPGFLALGVGQLPAIRTPWVALRVARSARTPQAQ